MARSKPYTKKLMLLDIVLTLFSGGMWMIFVVPFRELYRHQ